MFSATEFWMLNEEPGFALTSSPEGVSVKIDPLGKMVVSLQAPFWGNSPETVATMILAEQLKIDPADISIAYADTDHGLAGTGPGRQPLHGDGGRRAGRRRGIIKEKLLRVAGHMLEADAGRSRAARRQGRRQGRAGAGKDDRRGRDACPLLPAVDAGRADLTSGIDAAYTYDHPLTTLPSDDRKDLGIFYPIMGHMCHMPVVEVDPRPAR